MADVEGMAEESEESLKNDFAYNNNVLGAAKHVRYNEETYSSFCLDRPTYKLIFTDLNWKDLKLTKSCYFKKLFSTMFNPLMFKTLN